MDYFAVFLNSHRSNKEVSALAGLGWLGWAGLGEVIFHFTHNVPLPPYISQYTRCSRYRVTPHQCGNYL